jgi:glycosyltransferase involved in cell wall biosynthesis
MYLAFCKKFNYLEIHHNLTGISKILFFFKDFFFKRIFFILIHKNLKKILSINKHYIILDDAVDINNFKKKKKIKFTFSYLGSLYEGKGIEVVVDLAKEFPDYDFNIFGDIKSADIKIVNLIKKNKINNLKLHNHVNYFSAVKIIQASRYLLMPYLRKVMVRSKNLEVSNFMSPLKMFDYLASGNVLIASNLPVYSHILKNNYNCILADPDNFLDWKKKILLLLNNKINCNIIKKNALLTASKYTWIKRTKNILKNYKDKKLV